MPASEEAVDALLAVIGPEMSLLQANTVDNLRSTIAETLPLCPKDAELVDRFLSAVAEVHREEAQK